MNINKGVVAITEALDRFNRTNENSRYANGNGLIGELLEVDK